MNAIPKTNVALPTAYQIRQANLAAHGPVAELIRDHEDIKLEPYRDMRATGEDVGMAIGVGHNLEQLPISERVAELLYFDDLAVFLEGLEKWPVYQSVNSARKAALADMAYTLGLPKLMRFPKMIGAIMRQNWTVAGIEAIDSDWWDQQPKKRRSTVVTILITGVMPEQYLLAEQRLQQYIRDTTRQLAKDSIALCYSASLGTYVSQYSRGDGQFIGTPRAKPLPV